MTASMVAAQVAQHAGLHDDAAWFGELLRTLLVRAVVLVGASAALEVTARRVVDQAWLWRADDVGIEERLGVRAMAWHLDLAYIAASAWSDAPSALRRAGHAVVSRLRPGGWVLLGGLRSCTWSVQATGWSLALQDWRAPLAPIAVLGGGLLIGPIFRGNHGSGRDAH